MRHARSDYDRIQDPSGLIPKDEPVFLLRAQDKLAWHVVKIYAWVAGLAGADQVSKVCYAWADEMKNWPVKKTPDL